MALFIAKNIEDYGEGRAIKDFVTSFLESINKSDLRNKKVLIKPNFLKPSLPEKAIITHPVFLTAIIEALTDSGATTIFIGDSPGFGSLEAVLNKAKLFPILRRYNVKTADFSDTVQIKPENSLLFRHIELPRVLFDCDEIVNVPKLKTHQMMVLTLAVKNLYGCIYGARKIKLHLTAGEDHDIFATLLLDIYLAVRPSINILDGVTGMEGDGPSAGVIRKFGLVAASDDALALDCEVAGLLKIKPEKVPHLKLAIKHRLVPETESQIVFCLKDGKPVKLPASHAANFSVPPFLNRLAKAFFFSYPRINHSCRGCGVCAGHCPASAIKITEKVAKIDRSKCIRCYCCQELCEYKAVYLR